jgi:hypothetical protein
VTEIDRRLDLHGVPGDVPLRAGRQLARGDRDVVPWSQQQHAGAVGVLEEFSGHDGHVG